MVLKDKIAIVTGATGGLGRAIVKALVTKEAEVYGLGRNRSILDQLKEELNESFHPVEMDITDERALDEWVKATFNEDHSPNILINNAGVGSYHKIDETPTEKWLGMVNINLNSLFYITSRVSGLMKASKGPAHIINVGSILGKVGRGESSAYCATKFGEQGFSEALYLELRHYGIKVTSFNPGSIETNFFKTSGIESHGNMLQPQDLADTILHVLETPDNMLINEIMIRPLDPRNPDKL